MSAIQATRLCLVVPCYNEAQRFDIAAFTGHLRAQPRHHVIVVDDGSQDDTRHVLRELQTQVPAQVQIIELAHNHGKAEAVRVGLKAALSAGAEFVGYWDADLATPLTALPHFEALLEQRPELELVIGARVALLGRHIERRARRHYLGRVFATAASVVLRLPVYDTQCGAKLLRVTAATPAILAQPFCSRWIFDVELLARLLQGGTPASAIYELPLDEWRDVGQSRVGTTAYLLAAWEMMMIWRRYPRLRSGARGHAHPEPP